MAKFFFNVQQGSVDWYRLRAGIPTAGSFDQVMTPKTQKPAAARWKYACRLIAERMLNWQADSLDKISHIQEGKDNELPAVQQFEFVTGQVTHLIGCVKTNDLRFGASPDRLVGEGAREMAEKLGTVQVLAEIKAPQPPKQFEYLLSRRILELDPKANVVGGDDYLCQVMGQMWVAEAEESIFYSYSPRTPPHMVRYYRNEAFIRTLAATLEQFSDELEALDEAAKALGGYQKFAELVTPLDAEMGAAAGEDIVDDVMHGRF